MSDISYASILKDFWRDPTEQEVKERQKWFLDSLENMKKVSKCSQCGVDFTGNGYDLLGVLSLGKEFCNPCKEKYDSKANEVDGEE